MGQDNAITKKYENPLNIDRGRFKLVYRDVTVDDGEYDLFISLTIVRKPDSASFFSQPKSVNCYWSTTENDKVKLRSLCITPCGLWSAGLGWSAALFFLPIARYWLPKDALWPIPIRTSHLREGYAELP